MSHHIHVTITGADDGVDIADLSKLTAEECRGEWPREVEADLRAAIAKADRR